MVNLEELQIINVELDDQSFTMKLFQFMGPGFLMSMAYLDPGNIAGDMKAGIDGKFDLLYILLLSTFFGFLFQAVAAKIGVVTQLDLAQNIYKSYPTCQRYFLWIMCEIAIIGSDIQEVVGTSIALNILFGMPIWAGVLVTVFDTFIIMFMNYFGGRVLEGFFGLILTVMCICFWVVFVKTSPDWGDVALGVVYPRVSSGYSEAMLGLIGSIIMPHNFYLHSAIVLNRNTKERSSGHIKEMCMLNYVESAISLFISFIINIGIIGLFANYYGKGIDNIYDFKVAGEQLELDFGTAYRYIWGIGLLASGQASTMTGTYAGQYAMQGFLNLKITMWKRTLLTRSVAIVPALCVLFLGDFYSTLDDKLNILQSIQLPFAIIPLVTIAGSADIMGEFAISRAYQSILWGIGLVLFALNVYQMLPATYDTMSVVYFVAGIVIYVSLIFWVIFTGMNEYVEEDEDDESRKNSEVPIVGNTSNNTKKQSVDFNEYKQNSLENSLEKDKEKEKDRHKNSK